MASCVQNNTFMPDNLFPTRPAGPDFDVPAYRGILLMPVFIRRALTGDQEAFHMPDRRPPFPKHAPAHGALVRDCVQRRRADSSVFLSRMDPYRMSRTLK